MKKAQIKMFETIGVLVVFFFLLVAGAVFYFQMQKSSIAKDLAKQSELRALQSAQRAVFLPELDCSFAGVRCENSFDKYKLVALKDIILQDSHTRQVYFSAFGYSNISVREVFPGNEFSVPLYDNPPPEYKRAPKTLLPVLIYDPVSRNSTFAVMEVTTYAQE
jgi:hypothetical protein